MFHSVHAAGDCSIGETDIYFARKWNTNYASLAESYDFGRLQENNYKNRGIGSDEMNRAQQN